MLSINGMGRLPEGARDRGKDYDIVLLQGFIARGDVHSVDSRLRGNDIEGRFIRIV